MRLDERSDEGGVGKELLEPDRATEVALRQEAREGSSTDLPSFGANRKMGEGSPISVRRQGGQGKGYYAGHLGVPEREDGFAGCQGGETHRIRERAGAECGVEGRREKR